MDYRTSLSVITGTLLTLSLAVVPAFGVTIPETVLGSANPYLAGMPNLSTCCGGDTVPAQSPVQVLGLALTPASSLTFTVTGSVNFAGGLPTDPPDGGGFFGGTASNDGIASMNAPADALVGLFLDNNVPTSSVAPSGLDFSAAGGTSFTTLSPGLKQPFFIGDGLTGNGTGSVQTFIVPAGATRFFLGTVDGFGWFNNSGSFSVNVTGIGASAAVPEPSGLVLLGLGAAGMVGRVAWGKLRRNP